MSPLQSPSSKRNSNDSELAVLNDIIKDIPKHHVQEKKNNGVRLAARDLLDPDGLHRLAPSSSHRDERTTPTSPRGLSPTLSSHARHHSQERRGGGVLRFARDQWLRNKAPIMVLVSQLFGALMNLSARVLELDGDGEREAMHPMQILLVRMALTTLTTSLYIWRARVPGGVLGPPGVRGLLVARGVSGFFGIYCMWYSAMYLPLAEATVITSLAPNLAGYLCHALGGDPFPRAEQVASLAALAGVVLITRPASLLAGRGDVADTAAEAASTSPGLVGEPAPTAPERLAAVGVALVGVLGSALSFATTRWIGARAHPLTTVNYFSTLSAVVATATLAGAPAAGIGPPSLTLATVLPASAYRCALLLVVWVSGLVMLVLLTSGLAAERSNRATAMMYTHMLFAAGFDRWIFGTRMGWASLAGCGLIVGSAAWVALMRETNGEQDEEGRGDVESRGRVMEVEGVPMLGAGDESEDGYEYMDADGNAADEVFGSGGVR